MKYPNSIQVLEDGLRQAPDTLVTSLAWRIIEVAKRYDLQCAQNLGVDPRFAGITRNTENPPEYTHGSVLGAPWADNDVAPLEAGEEWNKNRRATNTGLTYGFNEAGRPVNPYMNTGMRGRGVLGAFGPNHAVDNGILQIVTDDHGRQSLHALCILRKADGNKPAFAGGFAKYTKSKTGIYVFDREAILETQVEELFEEMISGSVQLLPEYQAQLETLFKTEIETRMAKRNGQPISRAQQEEIKEQIATGLKLQQVRDKDPEFLQHLSMAIAGGRECFAGPILQSKRNTNSAWIESRLSWFLLDEEKWRFIKGENPAFDYKFSAGDDAGGVELFKIDSAFLQTALGGHRAMFAFMTASFLLDMQRRGIELAPSLIDQAEEIAQFLNKPYNGQQPVHENALKL